MKRAIVSLSFMLGCLSAGMAGSATAATVTTTVGSFEALQLATTGRPHRCIAWQVDADSATVHCQLASGNRAFRANYVAPMVWIKSNYTKMGPGSDQWVSVE